MTKSKKPISKMPTLSGYKIMWVMAAFDLPTLTKAQRKLASKFRLFLLDLGFVMMQLSVYVHHTASQDAANALAEEVGRSVPRAGKVDVLFFTDKQYGAIKVFRGVGEQSIPKKTKQLELF